MRTLIFLFSCCLGFTLRADETRMWVDATINGQRVHLIFDTGASDSILFRATAERLKLRLSGSPAGSRAQAGSISGQQTDPLNFTYGTWTARLQFGVIDLPPFAGTAAEGALSWYPLKSKVLRFDATSPNLEIREAVPATALGWPKFKLRSDTRILGFETGGKDPQHNILYVDTGAEYGVALSHLLWEKWAATRTNQPATMTAFSTPAAGMLVKQELWASAIAIGSLVLTDVPVRELDAKETTAALPDHAATLGLFALRRLNVVVDGANGIVYAQPGEGPVPAYPHNQLGAVFSPRDIQSEPLLAHVAPASPADLAGIRNDDVLLKIDDLDATKWRTDSRVMPLRRFWQCPAGTTYKLTLTRGERPYQATVVLKRILAPAAGDASAVVQSPAQPGEPHRKPFNDVRAQAERGEAQAQFQLGSLYLSGSLVGVARDEVEAANWFRKAADQNQTDAQSCLGFCYLNGQGVPKDPVEGVRWLRKAAEQNQSDAQNNLGLCYANGQGVAKDEVEAVKWHRRAAEQNNAEAQNNLGNCYAMGLGAAKDDVEAVKWFHKAAEQHLAKAQCNLGLCYINGRGIPKDPVEAVNWFRQASQQDLALAQFNLGVCYLSGQGVVKDEPEAVKWFRLAAEQNDPSAQWGLGLCYGSGQGAAKDEVQAYKWCLLASAQGFEAAKGVVRQLEGRLTAAQVQDGQKLAHDFKPREVRSAQR
jgi:TPR repeat protein